MTFDGRGSGRSDRPAGAEAYEVRKFARDVLSVLDATETAAVLVGVSCGAMWGVQLVDEHPERVAGAAFIAPAVPLAPPLPERSVYSFDEPLDTEEGWAKYNVHYWLRDYRLSPILLLEALHGAALHEAHRGLRGLGARDDA